MFVRPFGLLSSVANVIGLSYPSSVVQSVFSAHIPPRRWQVAASVRSPLTWWGMRAVARASWWAR